MPLGHFYENLMLSFKPQSCLLDKRNLHLFFPPLLYHLLSTRTLPFWTIFFGVLSPILRWKRRASFAPALKAELSAKIALVFVLKKPRLHQACARPSSCAKGVT